jgi:hypothetical protein
MVDLEEGSEDELIIIHENLRSHHHLVITLEDSDGEQPAPVAVPQVSSPALSQPLPDPSEDVKPDIKPLRAIPIPEFPELPPVSNLPADDKPDPSLAPAAPVPRTSVSIVRVPSPPTVPVPDTESPIDDFEPVDVLAVGIDETRGDCATSSSGEDSDNLVIDESLPEVP